MILAGEAFFLIELCMLVYCLLSVVTTPAEQCRNLPKVAWVVLVVLLPIAGGIAWLVAGRPGTQAAGLPYKGNRGVPPEYDRPGRATAGNPDDDAEFLRQLRDRAEDQRRRAAEQAERVRRQEEPPPV